MKGFGLFIVGQIAVIACLLCLIVQNASAQPAPFTITPGVVTANTTFLGSWGADPFGFRYQPTNPLLHWNLRLGESGLLAFSNTSRFRFWRDSDDPNTVETDDGAAINIFHAAGTLGNYTFSAGYATYTTVGGINFNNFYRRSSFGFEGNRTTGRGGALYVENANVNLTNLFFIDNHTVGIGGGLRGGGALFQESGTGTIALRDVAFGGWTRWTHFSESLVASHPTSADTAWRILSTLPTDVHWYYLRDGRSTMPGTGANWANTTVSSGGAIFSSGALTFAADASVSVTGVGVSDGGGLGTGTAGSHSPGGMRWTGTGHNRQNAIVYTFHDTRNTFYDNVARYDGGAIFTLGGPLTFDASAFASATATANANAGSFTRFASAEAEAVARAYGADFRGNVAGRDGGAIFVQSGTLTFTAGSVEAIAIANATATAGGGAGESAEARADARAWAEVYAAFFEENRADRGGAIFNTAAGELVFVTTGGATATVTGAPTPSGAAADPFRTAIANVGSIRAVTTDIRAYAGFFTGNQAQLGGAIFNDGGTLTFTTSPTSYTPVHTPGITSSWGRGLTGTTIGNTTSIGGSGAQNITIGYTLQTSFDTAAGIFNNNRATGAGSDQGRGGAIYNRNDGHITFTGHNRFYNNVAQQFGGAIFHESGLLTFASNASGGTVFSGNGSGFGLFTVSGGAIYNEAVVNMTGSILVSNRATQTGGAIFNDEGATVTLTNVIFQGNFASATSYAVITAGTSGGAIYNLGSITITGTGTGQGTAGRFGNDSIGSGNRAALGGAIRNHGVGTMSLTNLRFAYNEATHRGGAIYNTGGAVTITTVRFVDNKATGTGAGQGLGGAIYHDSGALLTITAGTSFSVNSARGSGGAIFNALGRNFIIDGVTFDRNSAGGGGGALWNEGTGTIANTTFAQNNDIPVASASRVGQGGAIFNTENGTLILTNNTFSGNRVSHEHDAAATGLGGAIYNERGELTVTNNIFVTNQAHSGGAIFNDGGEIRITGGRFGGGVIEENNTALFGAAIFNDGGVLTLNNVDFLANQAYMYGGAIYGSGGTINLNVTAGGTSIFEGNRAETWNFALGTPVAGIRESIFFAGTGNVFNVNVGTAPNTVVALLANPRVAGLQMIDPMRGFVHPSTAGDVAITQRGAGTWLLAGVNDFSAGRANFRVEEGILYLHRHNFGTVAAPNFVHGSLLLGTGSFNLASGATMIIEGAVRTAGGTLVNSGSRIAATGGITMASGSNLVFHLSEADIARTRAGHAALTLTSGTINVASTVNAYLTGAPVVGAPENWFEWFAGAGSDAGARQISVIGSTPGVNLTVGRVYQWDAGAWRPYTMERMAGAGTINDFVVVGGNLRMTEVAATGWTLHWTGDTTPMDRSWHASGSAASANWFGMSGGGYTYNFHDGDHVIFDNAYFDLDGVSRTVAAGRRQVDVMNDLRVGSLLVAPAATGYRFDFTPGVTLNARRLATEPVHANAGNIHFGSATVNIFSGGATSTTISAANSIDLGSSDLRFNLAAGANQANHGDTLLTLTTVAGQLTLGSLTVNHRWTDVLDGLISLAPNEHVTFVHAANNAAALQVNGAPRMIFDTAGNAFSAMRAASGVVYRVEVQNDRLRLVGGPVTAIGANLRWTGAVDGVWDEGTPNWFGSSVGANPFTTFTFMNNGNDQVLFDNTAAGTRNVTIDQNVNVHIMRVEGSNYVFNLGANRTLDARSNINFGSATLNMGAGSTVRAGSDGIIFGTLTESATIQAALGTEIRSSTINFTRDSDFHFNLTGAADGDSFLTLRGNVNVAGGSGAVGGGRINVSNVDHLAPGDTITLINIVGNGSVTTTGTLMRDGVLYTPQRSTVAGSTMLGLGTNAAQNQLWLTLADATANAELFWTGVNHGTDVVNSTWSIAQTNTNWSGVTTENVGVQTFLHGDTVIFDARADNRRVELSSAVAVESMFVADNTGYIFHASHNASIVAENNIVFGNDTQFSFNLAGTMPGSTILSLQGNVIVPQQIGSGRVDVSNVPTLAAGATVMLVDAGANNPNLTANTGELWVNGSQHVPQRSNAPNAAPMFGLDTNANQSQLLLKWVDAGANTGLDSPLTWTGGQPGNIWRASSDINYANWTGIVEGIRVSTFLDGDTVRFDQTALPANRNVHVAEGGVRIHSMFVTDPGYRFNLTAGGINAVGNQGIGESGHVQLHDNTTIVVGIDTLRDANQNPVEIVASGEIAADRITINGTARIEVEDLGIDAAMVREATFEGRNIDVDILVSRDVGIEGNVELGEVRLQSIDMSAELHVEGNRFTPGRAFVRLSYYLFGEQGWNHNTRQAGEALDHLRRVLRDEDSVDQLRWARNNERAALNQLRGTELVANSLAMALWRPWEITHQRTRNVREESGWNSWAGSYYRFGRTRSDGNALRHDMYRMGTMVGADYGSNRYWQLGGTFGYAMPRIQNALGKVDADDMTIGIYSKINFFDTAWVSTFMGYGYQTYNMTRHEFYGGERWMEHRARYHGDSFYASIEFVRPITVAMVSFIPLIALDHQTAWAKRFSETGSPWGQTVAGTSVDRTMVRFGVDSKIEGIGGGTARVDFGTRFQFAFLVDGDRRASVVSHFPTTNASMTLLGADMGWAQANIGVTASGEFRQRHNWFLDLDGFLTDRTTALQGQLGVSTRF